MKKLFATFTFTLLAAAICSAGIFRHDVAIEKYEALAKQAQFDCVGQVSREGKSIGSAVMISAEWAATAAHSFNSADDKNVTIEVGGKTYNATRIVIHPYYKNADLKLSTDLALVKIDKKYDGKIAKLYEGEIEIGAVGTIVGFGNFRSAMEPNSRGLRKLAGQNMIDVIGAAGNAANFLGVDLDSATDATANGFGDAKPLELEYIMDGGDSGGGIFIERDGKWFLAGINARSVHTKERLMKFEEFGFYGSKSFFTRVSTNAEWIGKEMKK